MATASNFFDIDLEVYMVKVSYQQKPRRRMIMDLRFRGGGVRRPKRAYAYWPGRAGASVSGAVKVAASSGGAKKYSLGLVLGHVLHLRPDGARARRL